jgi:hypothetical protein
MKGKWCAEKGEDYRVGVKFVNISLEDMDKLKNFLNYLKNIQNPTQLNIPQEILRSRLPETCGIRERRKK